LEENVTHSKNREEGLAREK